MSDSEALADCLAAIERVKELHHAVPSSISQFEFCAECDGNGPGQTWPCPTIIALAGPSE